MGSVKDDVNKNFTLGSATEEKTKDYDIRKRGWKTMLWKM